MNLAHLNKDTAIDNSTSRSRRFPRLDVYFGSFRDTSCLRDLIGDLKVDLIIDIDAGTGEFGSMLRRSANYSGEIHSFEPALSLFTHLSTNSTDDINWFVYRLLMTNTEQRMTLRSHHISTDGSFLIGASSYEAEAKRLDAFFEYLIPDFARRNILLKLSNNRRAEEVMDGAGRFATKFAAIWSSPSERG